MSFCSHFGTPYHFTPRSGASFVLPLTLKAAARIISRDTKQGMIFVRKVKGHFGKIIFASGNISMLGVVRLSGDYFFV